MMMTMTLRSCNFTSIVNMTPLHHRDTALLAVALLLRYLEIVCAILLLCICQEERQWNRCGGCRCGASVQLLHAIAFETFSHFHAHFLRLALEVTIHTFAHRDLAFLFFLVWIHGKAP